MVHGLTFQHAPTVAKASQPASIVQAQLVTARQLELMGFIVCSEERGHDSQMFGRNLLADADGIMRVIYVISLPLRGFGWLAVPIVFGQFYSCTHRSRQHSKSISLL